MLKIFIREIKLLKKKKRKMKIKRTLMCFFIGHEILDADSYNNI